MNILVDENIPWITIQELRALGHTVIEIRGTLLQASDDSVLWEMAQREQCVLVTTDKGFSEYRGEAHSGILIVRLRKPNRQKIHQRVISTIKRIKPHEWRGLVVMVRDTVQSVWRMNEEER